MPDAQLTHVDESGAARMVDVSGKEVTARMARAAGRFVTTAEVIALLRRDGLPQLATAAAAPLPPCHQSWGAPRPSWLT